MWDLGLIDLLLKSYDFIFHNETYSMIFFVNISVSTLLVPSMQVMNYFWEGVFVKVLNYGFWKS